MNLPPEAEKDKRIEELELALASEQQARWGAEQDREHYKERCEELLNLCLDCWLQFALSLRDGSLVDGGLSTLERLRAELYQAGLIDGAGRAVER